MRNLACFSALLFWAWALGNNGANCVQLYSRELSKVFPLSIHNIPRLRLSLNAQRINNGEAVGAPLLLYQPAKQSGHHTSHNKVVHCGSIKFLHPTNYCSSLPSAFQPTTFVDFSSTAVRHSKKRDLLYSSLTSKPPKQFRSFTERDSC